MNFWRGGENDWAPAAVNRLAKKVRIRAVDVADLPWTEIDTPEDLEYARLHVLPKIEGRAYIRRVPPVLREERDLAAKA